MLIQGAVLAYLYPQVVDVQGSVFEGLSFSLLMGLFLASSAVIAEAAKQRVASLRTWFVVESLYYPILAHRSGNEFYLRDPLSNGEAIHEHARAAILSYCSAVGRRESGDHHCENDVVTGNPLPK
jgi:hypothetical protein